MNQKAIWGWTGRVHIIVYNPDGSINQIRHLHNEVKNGALNTVRDALKGIAADLQIKYMAWGSGNTANAPTQTTLVAEFGRKPITDQSNGAAGVVITTTYIAPYEANSATIEELGWFAGAGATGAANSGLLVARVLYHYVKSTLENITVVRTDTI